MPDLSTPAIALHAGAGSAVFQTPAIALHAGVVSAVFQTPAIALHAVVVSGTEVFFKLRHSSKRRQLLVDTLCAPGTKVFQIAP